MRASINLPYLEESNEISGVYLCRRWSRADIITGSEEGASPLLVTSEAVSLPHTHKNLYIGVD